MKHALIISMSIASVAFGAKSAFAEEGRYSTQDLNPISKHSSQNAANHIIIDEQVAIDAATQAAIHHKYNASGAYYKGSLFGQQRRTDRRNFNRSRKFIRNTRKH